MKKILAFVFALVICGSLTACTPNDTESGSSADSASKSSSASAASDSAEKKFTDGKYLVGTDIESGLYRVKLVESVIKMGYVERASDVSMDTSHIIANIVLTGDGYVEIKSTDAAVKLQGVELTKISLDAVAKDIKTEVSDGIYLVGYDINPGTYKVAVTESAVPIGYVERAKSVAMGFDDIIKNEVLQGPGYVKVEEGDFAIRVQGATLTLSE